MQLTFPKEIRAIIELLKKEGFATFLVGGCVRDLLIGREPQDWDVATDAKPAEIQKVFPESVYENQFGTVAVKTGSEEEKLKLIEVTTFREEGKYSDRRHPDEIKFTKTIEEDLSRRDFTINAIALGGSDSEIIDPYGGQSDLKKKVIKAVGNPDERFGEDALRMMRAVRLSAELGFEIEAGTAEAIKKNSALLKFMAEERVRDELVKIVLSPRAKEAIEELERISLLKYIIPELREGLGMSQNLHHIYTVWEHNLRALDYAVGKNYDLVVRLAALLHDVGKPRTKRGEGPHATFYNHEVAGARMTQKIMERLKFPKDVSERVVHLVRFHLFYYNVGEVTEAGVRRFLQRVGVENVDDLMRIREADRIGSGVPKAVPYKLRHLRFMIDKVRQDPISPKMLKVNGTDVMEILRLEPSPKVGYILAALLEEVLDKPERNEKDYLVSRMKELDKMSEGELKRLFESARKKKEEFEGEAEREIKEKYYVK
ncbi:MAG TPA: HDIG domain-containing protein [Candidatus Tyrphobacter sp.]|nr:HDIG domain-containing protein [Candidatus Tyrphobacter sp.]